MRPSRGHAAAWATCLLAAVATAWFGTTSGPFLLGGVWPVGVLLALAPYPVLALLAWVQRRRPAWPGVLLVLAVLVGGHGVFFLLNDWYWPRPTHPNPWRGWIILVIVIPQGLAVGLGVTGLPRRPALAGRAEGGHARGLTPRSWLVLRLSNLSRIIRVPESAVLDLAHKHLRRAGNGTSGVAGASGKRRDTDGST